MPGWNKRFQKVRKEKKSTTDDPQEGSFNDAVRLLEQLKQPTEADLASLKPGQKIRFYCFQEGSTDAFWLEGRIAQRVTKSSYAKKSKYIFHQSLTTFAHYDNASPSKSAIIKTK